MTCRDRRQPRQQVKESAREQARFVALASGPREQTQHLPSVSAAASASFLVTAAAVALPAATYRGPREADRLRSDPRSPANFWHYFNSKEEVNLTVNYKVYCKFYNGECLVIPEPAHSQFPRLLAAPEVRLAPWATCRPVPCLGSARSAPTTSTRSPASRRCTSGTSPPCTPLPRRAAVAPLCRLHQERDSIVS